MAFVNITKPVIGEATKKTLADQIIDNLSDLNTRVTAVSSGAKLLNGSFEFDTNANGIPDSWTIGVYSGGSYAISTANNINGVYSLALTSTVLANGGAQADTTDYITVSGGQRYYWSFFRSASVTNVSSKMNVAWYDEALTVISNITLNQDTSTPTAITLVDGFVVAPSNARYCILQLTGGVPAIGSAVGTVYFDDIHFDDIVDYYAPPMLAYFGNGEDGAFTSSVNFTPAADEEFWYTTFVLGSAHTMTLNAQRPLVIRATTSIIIDGGTIYGLGRGSLGGISVAGGPGIAGAGGFFGGCGGSGGSNSDNNAIGGAGGGNWYDPGPAGTGGGGGTAGAISNTTAKRFRAIIGGAHINSLATVPNLANSFVIRGGAGGGSGSSNTIIGNDGGNGGGLLILIAPTIRISGTIDLSGGVGGPGNGGNAASGGGGGGGCLILAGKTVITTGATLITVGGAAGAGGSRVGAAGGAGSVYTFQY